MEVRFKKLSEHARIPERKHEGDAGADLFINSWHYDFERQQLVVGSGIAVEIPEGYVGLLFPRSSIYDTKCRLTNCVGVIDSNYRGEIMARFDCPKDAALEYIYTPAQRFGQLIIMPYPTVTFVEAEYLSTTDRGTGGYGSTGK